MEISRIVKPNLIHDITKLIRILNLSENTVCESIDLNSDFPFLTTKSFVKRIKKNNPIDPLLKQILPLTLENEIKKGFSIDPLNEKKYSPVPRIIHKYYGRVLLLASFDCAMHCRYCFRRHYFVSKNLTLNQDLYEEFKYIESDTSINEVILSGGDPLILDDTMIKNVVDHLTSIMHVKSLRIHTRVPIILPERICSSLINVLANTRLHVVLVIQVNHFNEISPDVICAISKFREARIPIFNQSVLLKGINDEFHLLAKLNVTLFNIGIIPYYIHMLDRVQGSNHFNVSETKAKELYQELLEKMPGYLVPKIVRENPGEKAKNQIV